MMHRESHESEWKRPLRPTGSRLLLYGHPDERRRKLWNEPTAPIALVKAWGARIQERNRLESLERDLAEHQRRLEALEARAVPCQMEIHTFAPEPYRVKKSIPILVRPHHGEFLASFIDANVNASGETGQEAFQAVKALILDMLDQLATKPKLGPKLASRLAILREFIDGPQGA